MGQLGKNNLIVLKFGEDLIIVRFTRKFRKISRIIIKMGSR